MGVCVSVCVLKHQRKAVPTPKAMRETFPLSALADLCVCLQRNAVRVCWSSKGSGEDTRTAGICASPRRRSDAQNDVHRKRETGREYHAFSLLAITRATLARGGAPSPRQRLPLTAMRSFRFHPMACHPRAPHHPAYPHTPAASPVGS